MQSTSMTANDRPRVLLYAQNWIVEMMLCLSAAAVFFLQYLSPTLAGSCNVRAELSQLSIDLVQLYVSDDADVLCLQNLSSLIDSLATNSDGTKEGLVLDSLNNSTVLFLVPLTAWEDLTTNTTAEWLIEGEQCWLQLRPILGFDNTTIHETDINDQVLLKAELCINDTEQRVDRVMTLIPDYFWYIHIHFDTQGMFEYTMDVTSIPSGRSISLHLWQLDSNPTTSDVRLTWMHAPSTGCAESQLTATIRSGCPSQKEFHFIYPHKQTGSELVRLPVNYRPPSPLGSSLPTSPHIYHADPSQPLTNTHFKISQNAEFKQCQNKASQSECNCTDAMEQSKDIEASDCIKKVYRHPYQQIFKLEFTIALGDGEMEEVNEPIIIAEVNGRTSFEITGLKDGYISPDSKDSVKITFKGPELFHFQATVMTNSSFCNLTTYFTVYVDRTPLMKATEYSIIITCTVVFGAAVAFMYLLHHFKLVGTEDHVHIHK